MDRLYHFTCRDGYRLIGRYNCLLVPQTDVWPYIWLTTEAVPDFKATGLESVMLRCDRRQFRYIVTETEKCHPWLRSVERDRLHPDRLAVLESYGDPEHWWIGAGPLPAAWDRSWAGPVTGDTMRRGPEWHRPVSETRRGKRKRTEGSC